MWFPLGCCCCCCRERGFLRTSVLSSDPDGRCSLEEGATHNGPRGCRLFFLSLGNHNGCVVVSLGSQLQEAQTVASWPQRAWYWSVYAGIHRIRLCKLKIYKLSKQPSRPASHHRASWSASGSFFISSISRYVASEACTKQSYMFWWHLQIFDFLDK